MSFGTTITHCALETWEWLPSGTNQWISGNTSIPDDGFWNGCAVKINDNEILLIGGYDTYERVLKFNTITKQFINLGNILNYGRTLHACTRFQDEIIIAGGQFAPSSTEIINLNDLTTAHTAGNFVQARAFHSLVVVHIDSKPTVLALGGFNDYGQNLDSIEMWNSTTETWTMSSMKLTEPKDSFGIVSFRGSR